MVAMTMRMAVFAVTLFVMGMAVVGSAAMIVVMVMPRRTGDFVTGRTITVLHVAGGLVHGSHSTRKNSSAQPRDCLPCFSCTLRGKRQALSETVHSETALHFQQLTAISPYWKV